MGKILVHNVSDRPNTPGEGVAVKIGGQSVRPGQFVEVDSSTIGAKHREMHGTLLWIGDLPARFTRTSKAGLRAAREQAEATAPTALTLEQVRVYLNDLTLEQVQNLATRALPSISVPASKAAAVMRLSRALFQEGRELDPEAFFWLGRWTRTRGGFIPTE